MDCACAYDPIHVTAQGKRLDPICACVQLPGSILVKTMPSMQIQLLCACVLYSMGSRGLKQWVVTSISHMGQIRDSDWSRRHLLRSDWLLPSVAPITTYIPASFRSFPRIPSCTRLSRQTEATLFSQFQVVMQSRIQSTSFRL